MKTTVNISLTLTREVLDAIDKDREDIKRSTYINTVLKDYLERNVKTITDKAIENTIEEDPLEN